MMEKWFWRNGIGMVLELYYSNGINCFGVVLGDKVTNENYPVSLKKKIRDKVLSRLMMKVE